MKRGAETTLDRSGAGNWLLRGLVLASMGLHLLLAGHLAGWYKPRPATYIELDLRADPRPPARSIPVPPRRKPPMPAPQPLPAVPVVGTVSVPKPDEIPAPVAEPMAAPVMPDAAVPRPIEWHPPVARTAGHAPAGSRAHDYFSLVRSMIEEHKRYPPAARRRRLQGHAVVRFVIAGDGTVTGVRLVASSRHRLLDEAAVAAVQDASPFPKPPPGLFHGPVSLEIRVVFQLT